jgi:hypothetical protein
LEAATAPPAPTTSESADAATSARLEVRFFMSLMEARIAERYLSEAYEPSKKTKAARKGRARAAFDGLELFLLPVAMESTPAKGNLKAP